MSTPGNVVAVRSRLAEAVAIHDLITDVIEVYGDAAPELDVWLGHLYESAESLLLLEHDIAVGGARLEIAIVGDFSAGKSTFINSIVGADVAPATQWPTTAGLTRFTWGPALRITDLRAEREISDSEYRDRVAYRADGTTRCADDDIFEYCLRNEQLRDVVLIDTPGLQHPNESRRAHDERLTLGAAEQADAVFVLVDINQPDLTASLQRVLRQVRDSADDGPRWYLVLNKADYKSQAARMSVQASRKAKYGSEFLDVLLYSSKAAARQSPAAVVERLKVVFEDYQHRAARSQDFVAKVTGERDVRGRQYVLRIDGGAPLITPLATAGEAGLGDATGLMTAVEMRGQIRRLAEDQKRILSRRRRLAQVAHAQKRQEVLQDVARRVARDLKRKVTSTSSRKSSSAGDKRQRLQLIRRKLENLLQGG